MKKLVFVVMFLLILPCLAQEAGHWSIPDGFVADPDFVDDTNPDFLPPSRALIGPIGFDEAEFVTGTQVDGFVTNSVSGVLLGNPLSLGFSVGGVSSPDATFTTMGPGVLFYNSPPNIEGDAAGTLTVDFGTEVTDFAFSFALNTPIPTVNAITVTPLFRGMPVDVVSVDTLDFGFAFAENLVTYTATNRVDALEITFDSTAAVRFVIDNLSYNTGVVVPTLGPTGLILFVTALSVLGLVLISRQRRAKKA